MSLGSCHHYRQDSWGTSEAAYSLLLVGARPRSLHSDDARGAHPKAEAAG